LPTYGYQCSSCGKRYEKREGFDAPARQKCQFCGKPATRILYAPPIVFKGSGFYKTDSRGTSSASTEGGSSGSESSSESKPSESKDNSKPAATPAATTKSDSSTPEAAAAG
jgi:putative FmdB family regulatory protein